MLLAVLLISSSTMIFPFGNTPSTDPTINIYAHKNSSTLNSGMVANTTSLFASTAQTVSAGATSTSQFSTSWDLYPCLASSITLPVSSNIVFTVYLTGNGTLSGVTLGAQVNEIATCGTGTETSLFGGEQTSTITLSATMTKFQVSVPVSSATTIPSGDSIHFIVYVNPNTADTQTISLYYDASNSDTGFAVPISPVAVTVNSFALSSGSISGQSSTTATLSVSDAFGLYDLASQKITVSIPGTSADPINAAAMTAASSNTPTSYTGTYTYSIDPSSTTYSGFSGIWSAQSTVTDNSGNSYSSSQAIFNYSPGGSCPSCTSQTSSHTIIKWNWSFTPIESLVIFLIVVLIVASAIAVIRH